MRCERCGCKELKVLEINHKNGGGYKERKEKYRSPRELWMAIIRGERQIDDFDIKCKVCNVAEHCEKISRDKWNIVCFLN